MIYSKLVSCLYRLIYHKKSFDSVFGAFLCLFGNLLPALSVLSVSVGLVSVSDIRALRGPDIGSDHNLLKIHFKVKLRVKTGNKYNEERKIVKIFQNPKCKKEYATEINNKFETLENLDNEVSIDNNINAKWENVKTIIKETKQQLMEKDEKVQKQLKINDKMRNANLQWKK